ncbi:MAG: hypothetical protein HUJ88_11440 [Fusobacterium necrophorum]|nr:hypothetical protein [Fusobacterium necrophorum]
MRVNLSFNEKNEKENRIIEFLETKLNATAYIKEMLYQMSFGNEISNNINNLSERGNNYNCINPIPPEDTEIKEEYEEILNIESVPL